MQALESWKYFYSEIHRRVLIRYKCSINGSGRIEIASINLKTARRNRDEWIAEIKQNVAEATNASRFLDCPQCGEYIEIETFLGRSNHECACPESGAKMPFSIETPTKQIDPACPCCGTPWAWIRDDADLKRGGHWAACCGCEGEEVINLEDQNETETTA
jgi:hypothetical protein